MSGAAIGGIGPVWAAAAAGALAFLLRGAALLRARRERRRLGEEDLLRRVAALPRPGQAWARAVLFAGGAALVAAAAAGPGAAPRGAASSAGPETVLVLDASNSMLAEDVPPRRLDRQRELAADLALRLPGSVGVVYFAGGGYVLSPLTADRGAVLAFVETVRPASVGRGGSALAAGLAQALELLEGGRRSARRSVVLFSDGEETAEEPFDRLLEAAGNRGVAVHTVAIGTADGGPIPLGPDVALGDGTGSPARSGAGGRFLRGPDGEIVVTRLDRESLRRIAGETGGLHVPGSAEGVRGLARRLAEGEGSEASPPPGERALLLLLGGFGLLWSEAFLFRRG